MIHDGFRFAPTKQRKTTQWLQDEIDEAEARYDKDNRR